MTLICSIVIYHSKYVFDKLGLIPENSISGNTLIFYVEKKVFSPQRGKMSFTGGIIEKIQLLYVAL
jgi:hypothetical protein